MHAAVSVVRENLVSLLFLVIVFASFYLGHIVSIDVEMLISENRGVTAVLLLLLMYGATVFAPVTVLPIIPVIAPLLGPFTTGLTAWAGWTLGAITAFWIARNGGRPLLERCVDIQKLTAFENKLPEQGHFLFILALRLMLPVDVLSYALGLLSSVSYKTYITASALGISWFSFAFAYLGYALDSSNTVLFVGYSVASLFIFSGALWYAWKTTRSTKN